MKLATVLAKTASGWKTIHAGEDIVAIRKAFKAIKVAGVHVVGSEPAEVAFYFDSGGTMMRKILRTPEERAAVDSSREHGIADIADAERARADEAAVKEGRENAVAIAEKAVAVIATEVVKAASPAPAAAPGVVTPSAPAAPASSSTPVPAAPVAAATEDDDTSDPEARFGGSRKTPKPPKR
jgi:hypothetical protein